MLILQRAKKFSVDNVDPALLGAESSGGAGALFRTGFRPWRPSFQVNPQSGQHDCSGPNREFRDGEVWFWHLRKKVATDKPYHLTHDQRQTFRLLSSQDPQFGSVRVVLHAPSATTGERAGDRSCGDGEAPSWRL